MRIALKSSGEIRWKGKEGIGMNGAVEEERQGSMKEGAGRGGAYRQRGGVISLIRNSLRNQQHRSRIYVSNC